jgi:enamine deaminase RidA (YjgF/YER057c/UK114 family)
VNTPVPHPQRQLISSGTPWETRVGYSRALRVGSWIEVSGTVAADEQGQAVAIGDAGAQARYILDKIERALQSAGSSLADVIRTRIYVTDMADWEAVAAAHGQVFGSIRPASTLVGIQSLVSPDYRVEIEATALIQDPSDCPPSGS